MRVALCLAVVVVVTGGTVRPASSQSLGDVGRREEERRNTVKSPAKVYTNKDLGAPLGPPPADAAASSDKPATATETPKEGDSKAGDSKAGDEKSKDSGAKDQAYWAKRKKDLDETLARDRVLLDAVQSRINALTADFAARADPVQRSAIERDRNQALAELARLQQEIKDTQKALSDLDEEAHKAGVPPGWLR